MTDLSRLEIISENDRDAMNASYKGVWKARDTETGEIFYIKRATPEEVIMTRRSSDYARQRPPGSMLELPEIIDNSTLPPDILDTVSNWQNDGSETRSSVLVVRGHPIDSANPATLVTADINENLGGKPITAEEYSSLINEIKDINEAGIFNHDFCSNLFIQRDTDGQLRFYAIDFEPHTFTPLHPGSLEDVAQLESQATRLQEAGLLDESYRPEHTNSTAYEASAHENTRTPTILSHAANGAAVGLGGLGVYGALESGRLTADIEAGGAQAALGVTGTVASGVDVVAGAAASIAGASSLTARIAGRSALPLAVASGVLEAGAGMAENNPERVAGAIGGTTGGLLGGIAAGAAAGAAAGLITGSPTGPGALATSAVGAVAGGVAGGILGEEAAKEYLSGPIQGIMGRDEEPNIEDIDANNLIRLVPNNKAAISLIEDPMLRGMAESIYEERRRVFSGEERDIHASSARIDDIVTNYLEAIKDSPERVQALHDALQSHPLPNVLSDDFLTLAAESSYIPSSMRGNDSYLTR